MTAMTVKEVMTSPVLSVLEDWSLEELTDYLVANNVTGVPVESASGEVVGVVSMTDIVRFANVPIKERETDDAHDYFLATLAGRYAFEDLQALRIESSHRITVKDLMTNMIFAVDENASVQQAADIMIKGNIHRLLVTKDRQIVGIVAALDLLKVVRDLQ